MKGMEKSTFTNKKEKLVTLKKKTTQQTLDKLEEAMIDTWSQEAAFVEGIAKEIHLDHYEIAFGVLQQLYDELSNIHYPSSKIIKKIENAALCS